MNNVLNSLYSITYSIVLLGAIMMGLGAFYRISYAMPGEPLFYNMLGVVIGISALFQIVLSLQGYKLCHT